MTSCSALKTVRIDGGFWGRLMEVNRRVTLPIEHMQCRQSGRIEAFKLDWRPGEPNPPHIFWDSDVAKWIEAAAYSLAAYPDAELEASLDAVVDLVAGAQQEDGYLNVHFTVVEPEKRWTNLRDLHELYCAGHLMEAAVACWEALGKRRLLEVMCRYADYIGTVFGPGEEQKHGYPGHEEIELALVKLHHATGEKRYLEMARYFVDARGTQPNYFEVEAVARGEQPKSYWARTYEYTQAHLPVREQSTVVGHSVRAMYLYCGMTDVAALTGDRALMDACHRLWRNVIDRRMHITGGLGPVQANEGFTTDFDLPNEGAYLETCAAVGLALWAWRLLQAELDGEYADTLERALFNGTISGVSQDGERFFYGNPLAVHPGFDGNGRYVSDDYHYRRSEWFGCACCPPNIARLIAQLPTFLYSTHEERLAVHLYAASQSELEVAGQKVRVVQETDYPWDGRVTITISPEREAELMLALRIPSWCRDATLSLNGERVDAAPITAMGYVRLRRVWKGGDRLVLELPMPVERIEAHPAVRQDGGRIALQRGPIVYCLEEVDNGARLNDLILAAEPEFAVEHGSEGILEGVPLIRGRASRRDPAAWRKGLYRPLVPRSRQSCSFTAIPYYLWANRQPGEMVVWINHES